jgi:hypothetical protein
MADETIETKIEDKKVKKRPFFTLDKPPFWKTITSSTLDGAVMLGAPMGILKTHMDLSVDKIDPSTYDVAYNFLSWGGIGALLAGATALTVYGLYVGGEAIYNSIKN